MSNDLLKLDKEYNNIAKAGGAPMTNLHASMEEAKRTGTVGNRNKAAWKFDRGADAETKNLLKGKHGSKRTQPNWSGASIPSNT